MPIQTAQELLAYEVRKIEDAESQASKALQQMSREVRNKQLAQLLEQRLKQGQRILETARKASEKLDGKSPRAQNAAARGLIEEAQSLVGEVQTAEMKEAVVIAGAQGLEHYCIAAWGTVRALAREAGEQELAKAMEQAVEEGYRWDEEMSKLAERRVNNEALQENGESQAISQSTSRDGSDGQKQQRSSSGDDLKSREYRGEDGQVHHHTKEYMERKGK
ncbi:YciE/YciF ferroxidase family protein [Chelativorans sp. YIM 93263]|uniref:YciE/YciF ferroxidase family protein n=1 Tax=Chelativorans sp. YIM 93263 TaxID=2906648 RepID=UPI00237937F4|nr:DUF892 family protein [Chelativorans sp. YIM 93263]